MGGILQENVGKWSAGGVGGCFSKTRETPVRSGGIFQQNAGKECVRSGDTLGKCKENFGKMTAGGVGGYLGCSRKKVTADQVGGHSRNECP